MRVRLDKRGRRIGRNWWREYICEILLNARLAWERMAEEATSLYATELSEYKRDDPMPTLKQFLIECSGMTPIL